MRKDRMAFDSAKMQSHDFYFLPKQLTCVKLPHCNLAKVTETLDDVLSRTNSYKSTVFEAELLYV